MHFSTNARNLALVIPVICYFSLISTVHSYTTIMSSSSSNNEERASKLYPSFVENLPSLQGKTIVVTGASRGLGYVTAMTCAKKGARVIMLNRPSERADRALAAIQQASLSSSSAFPDPLSIDCDLLDFRNVRKAIQEVKEVVKDNGIDVLCCNAGIMLQEDVASCDGYDITISTNVLSHFLLTKEFLPQLRMAAALRGEARVVHMSSGSGFGPPSLNPAHFTQRGGNLGGKEASYDRYHQSKLANFIITACLDEKFRASSHNQNIKAVACTPGVCGTDLFLHATTVMKGRPSPRNSVPSTEDGSLAQLKCIADANIQSGDIWGPKLGIGGLPTKMELSPPTVLVDEDSKKILWRLCEDAVGEFDLEKKENQKEATV